MFNKVNIPILGVLENMSVHICNNCGHAEAIFGAEGGKNLAERLNVPLLGQLPLSLPVREAMDSGTSSALFETTKPSPTSTPKPHSKLRWPLPIKAKTSAAAPENRRRIKKFKKVLTAV